MIRALIVNEIRLMSNVIAAVLEDESDIQVVGRVTDIDAALDLLPEADIVVVSTGLDNHDALELTQTIADADSEAQVLVVGLGESEEEVLGYVEAGAAGYVLRDDSVDELVSNIRAIHRGEALASPEVTAALMERVAELAHAFSDEVEMKEFAELTPREYEVLELIGRGSSNQDIAERLAIEVGTVKNHVHSILQKLNVSSRWDAAEYLAILERSSDRQ